MSWKQFLQYCRVEVLRSRDSLLFFRLFRCLWATDTSRQAVLRLRLVQFYRSHGLTRLAQRQHFILATRFGVFLSSRTEIGEGLHLPHPSSIVIGGGLSLGKNCRIYQQVTLAGAPNAHTGLMPRVGNNVTIYPGTKIIGAGKVGNNVIIGANSVVTRAFGDNMVIAGAPARIIKHLSPSEGRQ
ncbi:serine acetyltransferase [Oceanimonas sp. MB9]|uniref:serine acetyltransferase n=1 Tax=Oceanimonas sp. MB9 TaxID=2588453 RepID=UPI0013F6236C|nr:serine acetyltransferase [Oceanimonas sp. MB9]NHH99067.1 Serine acetyltransferase [Oceanimonas sp. MB9]